MREPRFKSGERNYFATPTTKRNRENGSDDTKKTYIAECTAADAFGIVLRSGAGFVQVLAGARDHSRDVGT